MNLFLDSAAIIKLYHKEKGTDKLSSFLSQYKDNLILIISDISIIEVHSALLKRVRFSEIDLELVKDIFEAFNQDLSIFLIIETDNIVKKQAIKLLDDLAHSFSLKTLDALHLSSAIFFNRYDKIDYFITSDKRFLNIIKNYFPILNPEEI